MIKKLFYIVFFLVFLEVLGNYNISEASTKLTGIENFPESYKPYLYELKSKYPNWEFTALYTGVDWNTAISNEYANDKNLVPLSYSDNWKCTDSNIYNVEIDKGWVNASKQAIEYTMDPRNFLNEVRIFQFEKLTYDSNINSENGVNKILYGTEFYNKLVSYKNSAGGIVNTQNTYANLIMNAGVYSGVSPYHLAARIKQEVGPFLTHKSISGDVEGYKGLYNFYNIGATSSTETLGAIKNGLKYALNGKGTLSQTELQNQLIPWDTPEKAIKGGAVFIGKSYILVGQNCLYLQKFDVNDDRDSNLFWHQYMTNCLAPYNEGKSIYNGYNSLGILNSSIGFVIPIYENMPEMPTSNPNINSSDYVSDNTKVYANVTTRLNVRTGPGTSYESLTLLSPNETFTRIGKGVQNGERWDKVLLNNGMVGYVFQSYVAIKEGDYFELDNSIRVNENEISNINSENIGELKKLINTNLNMEFYDNDGKLLTNDDKIGTGCKLSVKNSNGSEVYNYYFIIYGDVNGDGYINSLDVLILQKYILEIRTLDNIYLKSGNISKNGDLPSALDVLKIQKHILEVKFIEQ